MPDLSDYDLDDDFNDFEKPIFYDVSLCFNFMDFDDCITFEMVADGKVEDNLALVKSVIEGYGGLSEMEDGTVINLKQFVTAHVMETEQSEEKSPINSKFTIVH